MLAKNEDSNNDYNVYVYAGCSIRGSEVKKMSMCDDVYKESYDIKTVFILTVLMVLSFVVGNYFGLFGVFGF